MMSVFDPPWPLKLSQAALQLLGAGLPARVAS